METKRQNTTKFRNQPVTNPLKKLFPLLKNSILCSTRGKLEEAIVLLKKAGPCWEKANLLGCYHAELMEFYTAEKEFLEALRHDPCNSETLCNLAKLYNDFFQPYEAKKYLELYLQKEPNDAAALFYYAIVLLDLNLEGDAYEVLKKTYVINPSDVYVIINIALIVLHKKKRPKAALRMLKKAASISPADSEALFRLAGIAWELGEESTYFNAREMLQLIDPEMCAELDDQTERQTWL